MKLTIFRKGLILIAVPLAFELGFLGLLAQMQRQNIDAQNWSIHSKEVLSQAEAVFRWLFDAQTSIGNQPGSQKEADGFQSALVKVRTALETLPSLVDDNPGQEARARELIASGNQLLDWLRETQQQRSSTDQFTASLHANGRLLKEKFRRTFDAFIHEEEQLDAVRQASLARSARRLHWLLVIGGLIAVASTGLLTIIFMRGIITRVRALADNTGRLAVGHPLAPPIGGSDEVAELDRVFHAMADELARSQRSLREVNGQLEQRVAQRTAELARTNRELAERNGENETFVYSVSHDLRSPLVNLQGFSKELEAACREVRDLLTTEQIAPDIRQRALSLVDDGMHEPIRFIQTAVTRLGAIIDALLRLSRVGRVEYHPMPVDLNAVLNRVIDSMRSTISAREASVAAHDLPPVWADPTAVEQVFANLVGNSLNYLDAARRGEIVVELVDEGDAADRDSRAGLLTFAVRDNGCGIPAAHQAKLFRAFQRLRPDLAHGEGMGLAIVRRIVERHGGRAWVESTAGVGSVFYITLPAAPVDAAAASKQGPRVQERFLCLTNR